jgi:hypothetical protein
MVAAYSTGNYTVQETAVSEAASSYAKVSKAGSSYVLREPITSYMPIFSAQSDAPRYKTPFIGRKLLKYIDIDWSDPK